MRGDSENRLPGRMTGSTPETVPEAMPAAVPESGAESVAESAPESMDLAEAAARLERPAGPEPEEMPEAMPEEAPQETAEAAPDAPPEAGAEAALPAEEGPPEFWTAEDKAAWAAVPSDVRPLLRKYERQRLEFVNEKAREAAELREQARAEVERHAAIVEEAARWWGEAGPALQHAFATKWADVDWHGLAEKNPSEWARLNQQRLDEAALLAEAGRRGEADRARAEQHAEQQRQETRRREHDRLAARLPEFFGTPETAHRTYDALGRFLSAKGIAAERINAIHEAPIIEIALNAMRFEQAQQHALRSAARAREGHSAKTTPTRVAPGPAVPSSGSRLGNRDSEAVRQVGERFRRSGGASLADAAELIRLNEL